MINFKELKESQQKLIWGFGGGLLVSVINLPYGAILFDKPIYQPFISYFSDGLIRAIPFLISVIIVVPFIEELIFRVFLFRKLRDKISLFWGYFGSTCLFTLAHAFPYKGGLIPNAVSSLIITYIYQKTDSIKAICLAHSLWNFTWYAVIYSFKLN